jgi:shikimate dehydrogenase
MATADSVLVLTLADLDSWSFTGTALAVLGHPIKHSISPAMHNAALAELARSDERFTSWKYFRFDVPPEDLPRALDLLRDKKFRGLNLTVPHKVIAFDRVATLDPAAKPIGAVNTLLADDLGWHGFNTDGYGLATGIREDFGLDLAGSDVILLGAGGAARSAAVECLQRRCHSLWIANRTVVNLDILLKVLEPVASGIPVQGFDPQEPPAELPINAIVINATSAGLHEKDAPPVNLVQFPRPAGVFDMIYNPPKTRLLAQAESLGIPHANGLSMLINQGARALGHWTGLPTPVEAMRAAARAAMAG